MESNINLKFLKVTLKDGFLYFYRINAIDNWHFIDISYNMDIIKDVITTFFKELCYKDIKNYEVWEDNINISINNAYNNYINHPYYNF